MLDLKTLNENEKVKRLFRQKRVKKEYCVVDIETIPQDLDFPFGNNENIMAERYNHTVAYFQEKRWDKKLPKESKPKKKSTEEEIKELEAQHKQEAEDYLNYIQTQKSIEPSLAKICLIGIKTENWEEMIYSFDVKTGKTNEAEILNRFWYIANALTQLQPKFQFVTFNGLPFDFPMIEVRSSIIGVPFFDLPKIRYRTDKHFDIRMVLSNWNVFGLGNVDFWCNIYGIPLEPEFSGKKIIEGKDLSYAYLQGDMEGIVEHCRDDLRKEEALYLKLHC